MTLRKTHGNTVYRFAWLVEWSLFTMAVIVAGLNIYTAWQQGASVAAIPAIAMAFGWIVVACIELCTIPLAGSLALTHWREKPLNVLAVIGLCGLSMFTVYEFNEQASFNLTRGARAAEIENENDTAAIRSNATLVGDVSGEDVTLAEWMDTVKAHYADEVSQVENGRNTTLDEIDDQIAQKQAESQGNPVLIARINDLTLEVDRTKDEHARMVSEKVAALQAAIAVINGEKEQFGSKAQSEVKTGAFTGGAEKKASMEKQYASCVQRQEALQQQIQQAIASRPEVSGQQTEIQDLRDEITLGSRDSEGVRSSEVASLQDQRQRVSAGWQAKRTAVDKAYQEKVEKYQETMTARQDRAGDIREHSNTLRAGIISRTKLIDAQFEPILYYRMAKWFQSGEGLPTKEDYAQVQWFIFAPIGIFYSIVSIALAYLGMSMRREGSDQQVPGRVARNSVRREKRLRDLQERNLSLEEQACSQAMDLVTVRQEAFAAIKRIPQVIKLHEPDTARPSKALTWLPWCACMVMSLVALGAVMYSVDRTAAAVPMGFVPATLVMPSTGSPRGSQINNSLLDPVVVIQTEDGVGSGFFIQSDGLLLTNAHVIDGATDISILTRQGPSYSGSVVAVDESRDLALVKVAARNMPTLRLSTATNEHLGNDVIVVGSPHGLEWSMSKGIISSIRSVGGVTHLQTDAAMNSGNSGGPLIHLATGTVIGINTFGDASAVGIGFAVSADEVRQAFPDVSWD